MSIESHVAELERKHKALDQEIETELQHAGNDAFRIAELKRRKLHLKDEITRLKSRKDMLH